MHFTTFKSMPTSLCGMKRKLVLLIAVFSVTYSSACAQLILNDPQLLLGFRATGSTGADKSVVLALGTISSILSGATFTIDLSSATSALSTTYGNGWSSRTDLYWGVLGYDNGFVDGTATMADLWLSRTTGSSFPAGSTPPSPSLDTGTLAAIGGVFGNIQVASTQGGATTGVVTNSLSQDLQISSYANTYSGSWQSQVINGWGFFPSPTDSMVTNSLTVAYYTSNLDTGEGVNPVDQISMFQTGGFITVAASSSPTPTPTPTPVVASYVWTNSSGSWNQAANWSNTVPSNGVGAIFAGSGGFATNDLEALELSSLVFSNSSGAYILSGSNLVVGGITNNSLTNQTIALGLAITNSSSFQAASSSVVYSGVQLSNNSTLTIDGAFNSTIAGPLTGSGSLTKTGSGTAILSGSNSFSGSVAVNGGKLGLASGNAVSSANDITVSGGEL
ncbi:MAG: autotransporter-associated beta strand repeat-containing protein, partial [Verrucomicrobia bacterium]|nr:autotransporter-associated beta strand repeat-containing protein [Verrucomicrobiota bacterium]